MSTLVQAAQSTVHCSLTAPWGPGVFYGNTGQNKETPPQGLLIKHCKWMKFDIALNFISLFDTVMNSAVLHGIKLHCTALNSHVLPCSVLYLSTQHFTAMSCYAVQYSTMQCSVLNLATLPCSILHYTVLYGIDTAAGNKIRPIDPLCVRHMQCWEHVVQSTLYILRCTVHSVQSTVYSVKGTLFSVQCTV